MSVSRRRAVQIVVCLVFGALALGAMANVWAEPEKGKLSATIESSSGDEIGRIKLSEDDGTIVVRGDLDGLSAGFHGFHVHTVGICDPAATDPSGATVPFYSAGGHFNPGSASHGSHAGDMPPLLVAADGSAWTKFKTDRFTLDSLLDADGSAIIVHAGPDNLANIPATTSSGAERYHSHTEDVSGPDSATLATGDAGSRFGCGVVEGSE
jgi:Cu-Zn family superoxide dismutase